MSEATLLRSFDLLATAAGGVSQLRELILATALRGRLSVTRREGAIEGDPKALLHEFPIPNSWRWRKVGELCDLRTGATPSRAKSDEYFDGDIRWLVSGDIHKQEIYDCEGRITQEGMANSNCKVLPVDSVLIALNGQGKTRATVAILRVPAACNQSLVAMTPTPVSDIVPEFLFWNLRYRYREIRHITGDKQRRGLNMGLISQLSIAVPPIEDQPRIVARIEELMKLCDALEEKGRLADEQHTRLTSTLFDALANSESAHALAENWKLVAEHFDLLLDRPEAVDTLEQTILQLAVRGLLVPQDSKDEPASELLKKNRAERDQLIAEGKIKRDKPLPSIAEEDQPFALPSGWEWVRVGDVVEMLNGYAFKSEWFKPTGVRLLRNLNVSHGYLDWAQSVAIPDSAAVDYEKFSLRAGDVVLSLDRPIISTGLKYAVVRGSDLPCLLLQRVARLSPVVRLVFPEFLLLWLQSDLFIGNIDPGRSNGVPHISTKQVASLAFSLPPLSEQARIVTRVESLRRLCADLRKRLTDSRSTQSRLAESLLAEAV